MDPKTWATMIEKKKFEAIRAAMKGWQQRWGVDGGTFDLVMNQAGDFKVAERLSWFTPGAPSSPEALLTGAEEIVLFSLDYKRRGDPVLVDPDAERRRFQKYLETDALNQIWELQTGIDFMIGELSETFWRE